MSSLCRSGAGERCYVIVVPVRSRRRCHPTVMPVRSREEVSSHRYCCSSFSCPVLIASWCHLLTVPGGDYNEAMTPPGYLGENITRRWHLGRYPGSVHNEAMTPGYSSCSCCMCGTLSFWSFLEVIPGLKLLKEDLPEPS